MSNVLLRVYNNDNVYGKYDTFDVDYFNNTELNARKIKLGPGVILEDGCKIGNSVTIGANSIIRTGVEIQDNSVIDSDEDIFFQPLFDNKGEFLINESGVRKIAIACTSRTIEWWLTHGETHARMMKRPEMYREFREKFDAIIKLRDSIGYVPVNREPRKI